MSWIGGNRYLSRSEMENNALEVWRFFGSRGWSANAVAALCANMQYESGINPGIWQSLTAYSGGYGLVQWDPYTKYANWAGSNWANNGDLECQRIQYEADNGIQWFRNPSATPVNPPISFKEFTTSTLDLETLTSYFMWYYEHPSYDPEINKIAQRKAAVHGWYEFITGEQPPDVPTPPDDPNPPVSTLDFPLALLAVANNTRRILTGRGAGKKKGRL